MNPASFKEANKNLLKPNNMTDEECGPLSVFTDGDECISKWKMSWKERFHCLFYGYIWARIFSGVTQPPIAINAVQSVFEIKK